MTTTINNPVRGFYMPLLLISLSAFTQAQGAPNSETLWLANGVEGRLYRTYLPIGGGEGRLVWTLSGQIPDGLSFKEGLISGRPAREGVWEFDVSVQDEAGDSLVKRFGIEVLPPPPPPLTIAPMEVPTLARFGSCRLFLRAEGGYPPYRWAVDPNLPAWIHAEKDYIDLRPVAVTDIGKYSLPISVTDSRGGKAGPVRLPITVEESTLISPFEFLPDQKLPTGIAGREYYGRILVRGGRAPYQYTVNGNLPGLVVLADGTIQGTPKESFRKLITVEVTDQDGLRISSIFSLAAVQFEQAELQTVPLLTLTGRSQTEVTACLPVTGGVQPYSYTPKENFPKWLTLDAGKGILSGIPQEAGEWDTAVAVQDAAGSRKEISIHLRILPSVKPLAIVSQTLPKAYRTVPYSAELCAEGGYPPYRWKLRSEEIPAWLKVEGHRLLATPSELSSLGTYTLMYSVADAAGQETEAKPIILEVLENPAIAPLAFNTDKLPPAIVDRPYEFRVQASGGRGPYTYQCRDTIEGLRCEPDGRIHGVIRTDGQKSMVIHVSDADDQQIQQTFYMEGIKSRSDQLLCPEISELLYPVGIRLSCKIPCAGGSPPYRFECNEELPAGLRLDEQSGVLYGRLFRIGQWNIPIKISDAGGQELTVQIPVRSRLTGELTLPFVLGILLILPLLFVVSKSRGLHASKKQAERKKAAV